MKKCKFRIFEVKFLRFIVFTKEIRMNVERVRTIEKWFKSKIYREVQVFLDFANFYRRFIYRYSSIAASLTSLLKSSKKNKKSKSFLWIDEAKQAFNELRFIFSFASLLYHFDSIKKIRVKTDVLNFAVAKILSQFDEERHWRSMTF